MQLNQTRSYFWIKDRKKAVHVDLFKDKLGLKKEKIKLPMCLDTDPPDKSVRIINISSHLGHLDHIGELSQTGNRDHIMVGFQFGPGEVIKQSVWSESHIMGCKISQNQSDGNKMICYGPLSNFPTLISLYLLPPSPPTHWPK